MVVIVESATKAVTAEDTSPYPDKGVVILCADKLSMCIIWATVCAKLAAAMSVAQARA